MAKGEIERRVRAAADTLGLAQLLQRKPRQLSGGQRQRVAMGRAIVREPLAFLFDEPLSNLDAKLRVQMRHEIRQLQSRLGTTGIYVTHDQIEAMTLGDRLMILNGGVVEQIGTPLEVYRRPASTFVAAFIGSPAMSFVRATAAADGAAVALAAGVLPLAEPRPALAGRPLDVGIRPEHLRPVGDGAAGLDAVVEWVEALGADSIARVRLADGATLDVRLPGIDEARPGDRLRLAVEPGQLHLFDVDTGRRA
jgi:sn-glycerol 3-phosphate transport system ATP-binding protein